METRLPPPFVDGLALISILILWKFFPTLQINIPLVFVISVGAVLSVMGLFIIFAAMGLFRRKKTTVLPFNPEKTSTLVTSGIYNITRNPMYMGMALIILALAFVTRQPLGVISMFIAAAYLTKFQIIPEERALEAKFGKEYVQYKARVRRWI